MAQSTIEWTDIVWNPTTGCTKVSQGCKNCYAETMTRRLVGMGQEKYKNGFAVTTHSDRATLGFPFTRTEPRKIFVDSMSDLFHADVPFDFIDKVFAVISLCPHLTFQILTKRPELAREYFSDLESRMENIFRVATEDIIPNYYFPIAKTHVLPKPWFTDVSKDEDGFSDSSDDYHGSLPFPNVWLGTSIEDQETADRRIYHLLQTPAAVRFASVEPMLGHINLNSVTLPEPFQSGNTYQGSALMQHGYLHDKDKFTTPKLDWVICGGESGPRARPLHPDWVRSLRDQCQDAGVPFFFKQWGAWAPDDFQSVGKNGAKLRTCFISHDADYYDVLPSFGNHATMMKIGKHLAGSTLDGREWKEFPKC